MRNLCRTCATGAVLALGGVLAAGAAELKPVAKFDHQVTGVTVAPNGRRFVNFPRWTDDAPISVAELMPDGQVRPYPDEKWNSWRNLKA
ncbi:MAG: hypothetical protein M3O06_02190, partial [Pseudomonadota bacterium]|nr:hypothetical protein [Pseudomonadota bacterium]